MFQAWQCPPPVVRPLACRVRMPRGPLSVILRGSKLLAAKQVVKSTIVTQCGGHISVGSRILVSSVVYLLFRTLSHGANTPVVGPANCHWYSGYPFTLSLHASPCTGHPKTGTHAPQPHHPIVWVFDPCHSNTLRWTKIKSRQNMVNMHIKMLATCPNIPPVISIQSK